MKYNPKNLKKQKIGFVFNADDFLETVLPSGWDAKRLVSVKNNTVKETNLLAHTLANMSMLGLHHKRDIHTTIKDFAIKYGTGMSDNDLSKKLPHGQDLLRNRVEGALLHFNAEKCTEQYKGRRFIWLPSDAEKARHEHMLRYGKVFTVGDSTLPEDDNFPGMAFGCKCGYQWVEDEPSDYDVRIEQDVD